MASDLFIILKSWCCPSDVADEQSHSEAAAVVGQLVGGQGLNLLINNAGVAPRSTRINMVRWPQMVDTFMVNTVGPVMLSKVSTRQTGSTRPKHG